MTLVRHYLMTAKPGGAEMLEAALVALAAVIRPVEGCRGIELLREDGRPGSFVFIERWASRQAHEASGRELPKQSFAPVMAALAHPPEVRCFDHLLAD
ncbi:hypothetical protein ASE00_00350 [Sphingomonas sp. Root710]|uniref:putative quinol monooxygenase n=1 Tax=Sphingomonas sp. Root710 TaxID=1736594 RepID=UPI0006F4AF09|nr:antibiotic biosynthesis monooxygenase [Sphingomonas sp. Root710]KRB85297.1 hypothetical protein ASE00_00350 [Sphingomonas sp. Root710]